MRINNNIQALNAYRNLSMNQTTMSKHLEKLSSGLRINRASDDAAGLAISEKMRSQIRGLAVAERNSLDGISLIQTSEGALAEVHSMLQRMRELAVQSSNDTNTNEDRQGIQKEVSQLINEIDRISANTEFNQLDLLNGARSSNEIYGTEDIKITSPTNNANIIATGSNANNTLSITMADDIKINVTLSQRDYDGSIGKTAHDLALDVKNQIIGVDTNTKTKEYINIEVDKPYQTGQTAKSVGATAVPGTPPNPTLTAIDNKVTIKVNGTDFVVDNSALKTLTPTSTGTDIQNLYNNAVDAFGNKLSSVAYVDLTAGNMINIESKLAGTGATIAVTATGTDNVSVKASMGLTTAPTVTNGVATGETPAKYSALFTQNLIAGDKLVIGNQTYTAVATTATPGPNEFKIGAGATIDAQTADLQKNIMGVINTNASSDFTVKINAGKVILTEKTNGSTSLPSFVVEKASTPYSRFVADPTAANFTTLARTAKQGSLIDAINNLTAEQLISKGYKDSSELSKSKFLNDIIAGTNKFDVKYDEDKQRFAVKSNYKLRMDEDKSSAAENLGMTNLFKGLDLQIGANIDQIMNVNVGDMSSGSLGSGARDKEGNYINKTLKDVQIQTSESANEAFRIIDQAIKQVSAQRSDLGAYQNRLEHTVNSLGATRENLSAAESRIRDTDMASEMSGFTKDNIINQAATAMLAQANQLPQGVLQLLKG